MTGLDRLRGSVGAMNLLWPGAPAAPAGCSPLRRGLYLDAAAPAASAAVRYSSLSLVRAALPAIVAPAAPPAVCPVPPRAGRLIVALARPVPIVSVPTGQTTIILAMDVSRSMCSTDIQPSRLEAAKAAAAVVHPEPGGQHADRHRRVRRVRRAGPAADHGSGGAADAVASLTTGRRTAIGSGILKSIDAIAEIDPNVAPSATDASGRRGSRRRCRKGAYAPGHHRPAHRRGEQRRTAALDAAQQAADRGIRVYTIGFGTGRGGAFDPSAAPAVHRPRAGAGGGSAVAAGAAAVGGFRRGIDEDTLKQVADDDRWQVLPGRERRPAQQVFKTCRPT